MIHYKTDMIYNIISKRPYTPTSLVDDKGYFEIILKVNMQ